MKTRRIDHLVVASPDAARAGATFARLFALGPATSTAGGGALAIGDARLEFVTPAAGSPLAAALAAGGEGMAELCLTVASLEDAAARLRAAGVGFEIESTPAGRAIRVDPAACHGVRLTLAPEK